MPIIVRRFGLTWLVCTWVLGSASGTHAQDDAAQERRDREAHALFEAGRSAVDDFCLSGTCQPGEPYVCPENATCSALGSTQVACSGDMGFKECGGMCIPVSTCCDNADCEDAGQSCPRPGGSCGCSAQAPFQCNGSCYPECCPGQTSTQNCTCSAVNHCSQEGRWTGCTTDGSEPTECVTGAQAMRRRLQVGPVRHAGVYPRGHLLQRRKHDAVHRRLLLGVHRLLRHLAGRSVLLGPASLIAVRP